jgi:UDP-N-acetylmuramyl tripeptide synthase
MLDKILYQIKKIIPKKVFEFFKPYYHRLLSKAGQYVYSKPSGKLKVIGVTGTKGKSTTVFLISKFLKEAGKKVGMVGSLGIEIGDHFEPNTLKMTMPGRMKLQKMLSDMVAAGCEYAVIEVTSEGIAQFRHKGIDFDCAVFTNLSREHIEAHGSFENYYQAKQELFKATDNIHILNGDSPYLSMFMFPAKKKIFYSIRDGFEFSTSLAGDFNKENILAAVTVLQAYGIDEKYAQQALDQIKRIPGRMEFIQREPFEVIIDYAHTPDSLEAVYRMFKKEVGVKKEKRLICVLGSAGGGRDTWKRPVFGEIASRYCDEIFLTNEDPYEEDPEEILRDIEKGIKDSKYKISKVHKILDRREAIKAALAEAKKDDTVVITGKGSETTMALAEGRKIPWSEKGVVEELLQK